MDRKINDHTSEIRHVVRYLIGFITSLVGIADMLSVIVPRLNWSSVLGAWPILNHRVPAQSFTVVIGFFLIMLSYGLARGKKQHACQFFSEGAEMLAKPLD